MKYHYEPNANSLHVPSSLHLVFKLFEISLYFFKAGTFIFYRGHFLYAWHAEIFLFVIYKEFLQLASHFKRRFMTPHILRWSNLNSSLQKYNVFINQFIFQLYKWYMQICSSPVIKSSPSQLLLQIYSYIYTVEKVFKKIISATRGKLVCLLIFKFII